MILVAKLTALNGKEEETEQALRNIIPLASEEVGTITNTLRRDQNTPRVFLFMKTQEHGCPGGP